MAEPNQQVPINQQGDGKRVYRGRPENQMDPQAIRQPPIPRQRQPPRRPLPKALNKPTKLQGDVPLGQQKLIERSPLSDSVFSEDITVREVDLRTTHTKLCCKYRGNKIYL